MSALTFHPPTPARLDYIAERLRAADRVELAVTAPGRAVAEVLHDSVLSSRWSIVAEVDGVASIAYGVAPTADPLIGSPWLLATDDLRKVRREFIERCRGEVRLMQQKFLVLTNEVHRDNALSIRWLEWLGFTIDRARPVGPNGEMFVFWKGNARHV
ncbi:hypothetical protein [Lysobacter sp. ESA13C]|uniref:hypothetical protein n=1 Tax=Lysobacter sp. ESA13C TaxID=2862676 RepID=UPI001CBAEBF3|nr:hypothetical protein [Lysobacter sp. ESA13C]